MVARVSFEPLVKQELATINFRYALRGPRPAPSDIVILAIDERSINVFDEEDIRNEPQLGLLQSYPFPRRAYAVALQRLGDAGAKVIAFDLLFQGKASDSQDDQLLQAAVEKNRDRVVLGMNISDVQEHMRTPETVVPPIVPMTSVAGFVNYFPDLDGFVRHAVFKIYASDLQGRPLSESEPLYFSFPALVVQKVSAQTPIPGRMEYEYIHFLGPPGTFPVKEFYKIFYERTWKNELEEGKWFRGKIVLIGPEGNFHHDSHPTPFGEGLHKEMPGVEIHAAAIATLLQGSAPQDSPIWWCVVSVLLLALASAALLNRSFHPLLKLFLVLGLSALYFGLAVWLFNTLRLIVWVAAPLWTTAGCGVLGIAMQVVAEQLEKRRVRQTLERYVSKPVADEILRHRDEYEQSLGGQRKRVTMLFSDIRGFTSYSEQSDPVVLVQQLNEYLTAMVEIVMKHGGTLDKFIGDAIMAVYGAPTSAGPAEDAWKAVQTAYEMRLRLAELQRDWAAQGRPLIKIGIGINHGEVVVGNIGSPARMQYTVIGDPVNVASRVEGLNKELGTDILLTETVYELIGDRVDAQLIGEADIRGREKKIRVYFLKSVRSLPMPSQESRA